MALYGLSIRAEYAQISDDELDYHDSRYYSNVITNVSTASKAIRPSWKLLRSEATLLNALTKHEIILKL